MKASMNVVGIGAVQMQLTNIARRVPQHAARTMQRSAARIVKIAKIMVPEDTGALMDSIRIERSVQSDRRLYINVIAGNQIITLPNGDQIDLNQYALIIHENYESMNPGARTLDKMAEYPQYKIGSGFLTRAAEMEQPVLEKSMINAVKQIITEETGQ